MESLCRDCDNRGHTYYILESACRQLWDLPCSRVKMLFLCTLCMWWFDENAIIVSCFFALDALRFFFLCESSIMFVYCAATVNSITFTYLIFIEEVKTDLWFYIHVWRKYYICSLKIIMNVAILKKKTACGHQKNLESIISWNNRWNQPESTWKQKKNGKVKGGIQLIFFNTYTQSCYLC